MRIAILSAAALLAGVVACKNAMAPISQHTPPPVDLRCSATALGLDSSRSGVLSAGNACRTQDLLNGESTYTKYYAMTLQAGNGYLVTMQPMSPVTGLLEMTTADTIAPTLLAASRDRTGAAELVFVAANTEPVTIRATTRNGLASDTGGFAIVAHACKVPVPAITDFGITHSDATTAADCQLNLSALDIGDGNASNLHLYGIHVSSDTLLRLVTFSASGPVRVFFGGPHGDTFGQVGQTMMGYLDSATTGTSFYLAAGTAGDYTLAIGGDQSLPAGVTYTVSIGAEQPFPAPPTRSLQFGGSAGYLQAPSTGRSAAR